MKHDKIVLSKLSKLMKYSIRDLREDFPDEDACLAWLVEWLYPDGITCKTCLKVTKHHKLKKRKVYSCDRCGRHVSPTSGTIFHKSSTPLTVWYHAFFLMSTNKAGTSAMQLMRETGVSYPTAHRIMHKIRELMDASDKQLEGQVEIDETYVHANVFKRSSAMRRYGPTGARTGQIVFAMLQRGGEVKVRHVKYTGATELQAIIKEHVKPGSLIYTDEFRSYHSLHKRGYRHFTTNHSKNERVNFNNHTQNIENFFSTWKPRMKGVFKGVSAKYLQLYAQEYAWRYSHRNDICMFWSLMSRITFSEQRLSGT